MFVPIRVAQWAGPVSRHDNLLLNRLWNGDPSVAVGLEENSWWVEVAADDDPDDETRATVNEFLLHTFKQWGFTNQFLDIVRAAQLGQYQFVRITGSQ